MRINLIQMRQTCGYDTMIDVECSTVEEMTGFRHSRALLPPRPPDCLPLKCRVFGRDERCSAFLCAFAPHPPNPLLPQGEKGEFGHPDA